MVRLLNVILYRVIVTANDSVWEYQIVLVILSLSIMEHFRVTLLVTVAVWLSYCHQYTWQFVTTNYKCFHYLHLYLIGTI
jgi:hypothetical protein